MIAFDFKYFKPATAEETCETWNEVQRQGEKPMIFSGGTEIITFARVNKLYTDAVIDIKGIKECNVLELQENEIVIGAAVSLNKITDSKLFPLLGDTVKQIADRTSRNKITIGGNINSQLIYKEGVLPLLLVDAKVKLAKKKGEEVVPLQSIFDKELKMGPGEMLLQVIINASAVDLPYANIKRTKFSKVGYPVVSVAALVKDNQTRVAFSGVCSYPFRSHEVETILNDSKLTISERVEKVIGHLSSEIIDDLQGTKGYRIFVLRNILLDIAEELGMAE
ncbi:FAD binding domain-containing protein [Sporosarcina aquimarina]|uniref:FAD binding domain-containing protein n=1 Tax=Sporosarcina aquimarina TaxID=114975 RepID=A0ABU4FUP2_9BACL|nr:FAD binding domain-containing protein [Sporosarcina aquimarina]MDW0108451.1 FAD binding domain-containing protein [Sporosarcina aquimarina]